MNSEFKMIDYRNFILLFRYGICSLS